jgi:NTP pyrophosphatase (non-canonical NTP hydrolase)
MKKAPAINDLLRIMARLRAPQGCPWDRQQTHASLRFHAVEEVYEMIDAIEAGDDAELEEELGDLLLQVVFHCQLARERGAFDFERVARRIADKLIHRHPHVFGDARARTVAAVWEQWDRLKRAEKHGTRHQRDSALDGIPRHLPALLRAQKLVKKAAKAGLARPPAGRPAPGGKPRGGAATKRQVAAALFALAQFCQEKDWSAEELLRQETGRCEKAWRRAERKSAKIVK